MKIDREKIKVFLELLKSFVSIVRGAPHVRFSSVLVKLGVLLLMGPPLGTLVAVKLLGIATSELGHPYEEGLWGWIAIPAGFLLIFLGMFVYLRGTRRGPGGVEIEVADNSTFKWQIDQIAGNRGKVVSFLGFTEDQLNARLARRKIRCSGYLEAINLLGQAVETDSFPNYEVSEDGSKIILRTTS